MQGVGIERPGWFVCLWVEFRASTRRGSRVSWLPNEEERMSDRMFMELSHAGMPNFPEELECILFSWSGLFGSIGEYCFGTVMQCKGFLQEVGIHGQFLLSMKHFIGNSMKKNEVWDESEWGLKTASVHLIAIMWHVAQRWSSTLFQISHLKLWCLEGRCLIVCLS